MFLCYLKRTTLVLLSLICFNVLAVDIATITLKNGATVILQDDFTWEYAVINPVKSQSTEDKNINTVDNSSTMNQNDLLRFGLLTSAAKSDVKVAYTSSIWRDQELGLKFKLTSSNAEGVVVVNTNITFYDDNGRELTQQKINVWQASYRQPETYLRKEQTRDSKIIWIQGIDKQHWKNKLLSLKVIEVKTR
jgi:hypothetical protein